MSDWISVKDRMPPKDVTKKYLVVVEGDKAYDEKPFVTYRFCVNGKFEPFQWSQDRHITYWMPFPEPPDAEIDESEHEDISCDLNCDKCRDRNFCDYPDVKDDEDDISRSNTHTAP